MGKVHDLTNLRFGRLLVIKRVENDKDGGAMWLCRCDCNKEKIVRRGDLLRKRVKSCGCLKKENSSNLRKTHGMSKSRIYKIWRNMKTRCYNCNDKKYKDYGARGITICKEWKDNFYAFYEWAVNNGYKENESYTNCTIDRIDNNKGYYPENCRWTTLEVQANNKRTNSIIVYNGESDTIHNWCRRLGLSYETVRGRMRNHPEYSAEQLFLPTKKNPLITYQGKTQCIRAWSRELGIPEYRINDRYHRWGGDNPARVLSKEKERRIYIEYKGETLHLSEWCRRLNLKESTIRGRRKRHPEYPPEKLFAPTKK